jgi:hypothetical protein
MRSVAVDRDSLEGSAVSCWSGEVGLEERGGGQENGSYRGMPHLTGAYHPMPSRAIPCRAISSL